RRFLKVLVLAAVNIRPLSVFWHATYHVRRSMTCREEQCQIVRRVHESRGCCGARSHADPTIGYAGRGKRYPMREVCRLVKQGEQKSSEDHGSDVAGGLSHDWQ